MHVCHFLTERDARFILVFFVVAVLVMSVTIYNVNHTIKRYRDKWVRVKEIDHIV
jgi:hypothetical protein